MLKKLLLILLSTSLCAAEEMESPRSSNTNNTSYDAIKAGIAGFLVYTIIPKIEDSEITNLATAAGAALCVYSASQVYTMARDIYKQNTQSEEKKVRINEARQKNGLFAARKEFRSCLMRNIKAEKNDSGRPVACEDLASMFAAMAGKSELDQITTIFNDFYRN